MTLKDDKHKKTRKSKKLAFLPYVCFFCLANLFTFNTRLIPHVEDLSSDAPSKKKKKDNWKRTVFLLGHHSSHKARSIPPISTWVDNSFNLTAEEEALYENPIETLESEKCKAIKEWQLQSFPACNIMHELALSQIADQKLPGSGGKQAHIWRYRDESINVTTALRNLRPDLRDYNMEKFNEWRIDNLVLERLTFSPNVMDIYGYCGTAGLYEYSKLPSLGKQIRHQRLKTEEGYPADIDTTQLLRNAVDCARGLADLHSFDGEYATVGHGDIAYHQFIYLGGVYKLIDFNDGFLLTWDPERKKVCNATKTTALHGSVSPEEFQYGVRTEKSDVFSFGTVLYSILTGFRSYADEKDREIIGKYLMEGVRSPIPEHFKVSEDPVHIALIKAMNACWAGNPEERPSAREVANELGEALEIIEKERNSTDGQRWLGKSYGLD